VYVHVVDVPARAAAGNSFPESASMIQSRRATPTPGMNAIFKTPGKQ